MQICEAFHIFITNGIFHRMRTKYFTFVWKHKRSPKAKAILRKKIGAGGINLPDFRLHYKSTVIKTVPAVQLPTVSMVPAQKQKYRSMEQDRKLREKPTHP